MLVQFSMLFLVTSSIYVLTNKMESYTFKYLKGYSAELLSIILGIVSLFVVVPFISANKEIYGVYSLCISTWVFLSYADLGFLGAATKYAAEFFQLKKKKEEAEVLSFGAFVLFVVACLVSLFYLLLSFNPEIVIKDINESPYLGTAKQMFVWMAVFSPFIALQRLADSIFSVRVERYICQFVSILGSIIKISSVFYFFTHGRYSVVQYFVFIQSVSLLCSLTDIAIAHKRYDYDLKHLYTSFRWNNMCYRNTKDLALSSFAMSLSWILYYEIDQIIIARFYGAEQVATFAIAFAILNYVRMFMGGLFAPFIARFAHFRADNNIAGLKDFFVQIVNITMPIVVCPLLALSIMAENFVVAWSGPQYLDAVPLTVMFVLLNIFSFLSYPTGSMITVFEKVKTLTLMAILLPVVYWSGILIMPSSWSILPFGIMKVFVFWLLIPIYSVISFRILSIDWHKLLSGLLLYNLPTIIIVSVIAIILRNIFMIPEKGVFQLLEVCGVIFLISLIGYIVAFLVNPYVRKYVLNLRDSVLK